MTIFAVLFALIVSVTAFADSGLDGFEDGVLSQVPHLTVNGGCDAKLNDKQRIQLCQSKLNRAVASLEAADLTVLSTQGCAFAGPAPKIGDVIAPFNCGNDLKSPRRVEGNVWFLR